MFGQQNTTPFGSPPATSPFGQPQQQQQQSAFGTPAPAFGGTSAFGQQAQTPAFGQPQQQQNTGFGGGGFGAPTPAPSTGFGGGGFGSVGTSTSPFGAPSPSPGLFGSSAPAPSGGLFGGGSGGAITGGFGSTTTQQSTFGGGGGFGSTTGPTFGAPAAPSAFGAAPATSGGSIFGSSAPAPSAFGASPPVAPSLFGAPAPAAPGGSIFGAPAAPSGMFGGGAGAQGVVNGTSAIPFQPTTKTDGSSTIRFESITAMPQYDASRKSFEELRFEDYSQGNRGTGSATGGAFGATGASTTTGAFGSTTGGFGGGGAFGSTAPAPAPTGGLFGQPAAAPAPAFGGFGAPASAPTGGLFGSMPAPAPSTGFGGFGAPQPAPAPAGGLFGSPSPAPSTGLFGQPAPAPSGGLFGSAPAPAPGSSLFGSMPAPAPSTGFGGFGAPQPAPAPAGGLFGAPAPSTGLFGQSAPAPSGGLFGSAPAPTGGLFGSTPAPAPSTGFGFGAPQPAPAGGSIFGSPAPAPGGMFGAPAPAQGGLFGAPAAAQPPAAQPFASQGAMIVPPATDAVLQQQLAAIENQRKELEQMDVWRGGSPQSSTVIPVSNPESQGLRVSPYSPPMSSAVPYRASPRSIAKIRPRGLESPKLPSAQKTPMPFMSPDGFVASATKRLVIKSTTPKPTMRLRLRDIAVEETKEEIIRDDVILRLPAVSPPAQTNVTSPPAAAASPAVTSPPPETTPQGSASKATNATPSTNGGYDFYQKVMASAGSTPGSKKKASHDTDTQESLVPKLTLNGYAVSPTLEEMTSMSEADLATVSGFTVTRGGVGSVSWDGSVDVRGIDLDKVITIEPRDVAVYDDQERAGTKPAVGNKLNRPAVITMYDVFPKEGSDKDATEKFERKIARTTKASNAELISYDSSSGIWKFRVPHFSRYALLDDSDDEDDGMQVDAATRKPAAENFEPGERGGRSPQPTYGTGEDAAIDVGASWFGAFHNEDEEMLDVTVARSKENDDESEKNVIREAENAYLKMSETVANDRAQKSKQKSILKKQTKKTRRQEEDNATFLDEGVIVDDSIDSDAFPELPTQEELVICSRPGICSRIAQKTGIQSFSASSTDYGMRMGRSFRVGWNPDGSFLHLQSGSAVVLQKSRPVFTKGTVSQEEGAKLLETHLVNANRAVSPLRQCPTFCLDPTDDEKLRKTLSDYVAASVPQEQNVSDPEESLVLTRAFSLLMALFAEDRSDGTTALVDATMIEAADEGKAREALTEKRRIDACVKWLTVACAEDVRNDIRDALGKNDVHSAIFAAATGGDIEQASFIAINNGYLHLATLLATGAASFDLIRDQVRQWEESGAADNIPADLLRIYTILGGDLNSEEQIHLSFAQAGRQAPLDWRRRLCMLLTFGVHADGEDSLASLVELYGKQVIENKSPFPSPRYIWNGHDLAQDGPQSLLYKIIELSTCNDGNDTDTKSLAEVVTPAGYTTAICDFSGAFHVAAAISALGIGASLSPLEQARVLDGYACQLVNCGRWDLAVYVMLCSFGVDRPQDLLSRERIAKTIVLQQCPDVPGGATIPKRAELEQIGVPSAWFEEALAYRCGNKGDSFAYISHLGKFSLDEARTAIEELIVPNSLFMNNAGVYDNLQLLGEFASDEDSLAATVVDFFQLAEDIVTVSSQATNEEEKDAEIASLKEFASSIKARFRAQRSYYEGIRDTPSSLCVVPNYRLISISTFLAEALAGVSFLQLQLGALSAGGSIWDDAYLQGNSKRPLKVASELALIAARNADFSTTDGETTASKGSPSMALTGLM